MSTEIKQRLRRLLDYARFKQLVSNQREFGNLLGYTSEQYISKLFSGNATNYSDFVTRTKRAIPEFNEEWFFTGVGDVAIASDGANTQIIGSNNNTNSNNINSNNAQLGNVDVNGLINEIRNQREMYIELLREKDKQIDKLITLLTNR